MSPHFEAQMVLRIGVFSRDSPYFVVFLGVFVFLVLQR